MFRYRIDYAKKGTSRYTGMLDLQKVWERLFRRANLPICYSQGFHPLPKFQMAAPLPLGFEGDHELADIWLEREMPAADLVSRMALAAPAGIVINDIHHVELGEPVLQMQVHSALFICKPLKKIDVRNLEKQIRELLQQGICMRIRRNKEYDLRPLILALSTCEEPSSVNIEMKLLAKEGATGRPDEVIAALDYDPLDFSYCRQRLFLLDK